MGIFSSLRSPHRSIVITAAGGVNAPEVECGNGMTMA